jgi:hypothetical protein
VQCLEKLGVEYTISVPFERFVLLKERIEKRILWWEVPGSGGRSRQANPECEEKHVIGKKTSLGNTIQGPSGKRTPPGKGWPPAGSEHCVVGSDVGTKRMERVLKPCD